LKTVQYILLKLVVTTYVTEREPETGFVILDLPVRFEIPGKLKDVDTFIQLFLRKFLSVIKQMVRRHKNQILLILPISALIIFLVLYAPTYLNYADPPTKADAVVLFVGPDVTRVKEAIKLLDAGYADVLIVPAYSHIYRKADRQSLPMRIDSSNAKYSSIAGNYPSFYEKTHIEVLEAKRIMDRFGFKKANFVSSPYHMRRIKVMADHVFHLKNSDQTGYQIKFVPSPFKPSWVKVSPWDLQYMKTMASEYIKMAWFYSYIFLL
jgi:hypothetical protein